MKWDPGTPDPAVGSFMPGLRWAVEHTAGPVLELGTGYFSTPYLAGLQGRRVASYEYDPEFAADVRQEFPGLCVAEKFEDVPSLPWSVVLVDCEGWNRAPFFAALLPEAPGATFVIHDSQDPWIEEKLLQHFQYRHSFGGPGEPRTTLVSAVLDVRRCGL